MLVKLPVPVPSDVWEPPTVGFEVVLQHTPRAVTVAPPSFDIKPPLVTEIAVLLVKTVVVRVGITASFLQLSIIAIPAVMHTKTRRGIILFILKIFNYFLIV